MQGARAGWGVCNVGLQAPPIAGPVPPPLPHTPARPARPSPFILLPALPAFLLTCPIQPAHSLLQVPGRQRAPRPVPPTKGPCQGHLHLHPRLQARP